MKTFHLAIRCCQSRLSGDDGVPLLLRWLNRLCRHRRVILPTDLHELVRCYTLEVALVVLECAEQDSEASKIIWYGGKGDYGQERPTYKLQTVVNGDFFGVLSIACQWKRGIALSCGRG